MAGIFIGGALLNVTFPSGRVHAVPTGEAMGCAAMIASGEAGADIGSGAGTESINPTGSHGIVPLLSQPKNVSPLVAA
jgi:hypothetical protein